MQNKTWHLYIQSWWIVAFFSYVETMSLHGRSVADPSLWTKPPRGGPPIKWWQSVGGWIHLWCEICRETSQSETIPRACTGIFKCKYDTKLTTQRSSSQPPHCICVVLYHSNCCHRVTCLNEVWSIIMLKYDSLISWLSILTDANSVKMEEFGSGSGGKERCFWGKERVGLLTTERCRA